MKTRHTNELDEKSRKVLNLIDNLKQKEYASLAKTGVEGRITSIDVEVMKERNSSVKREFSNDYERRKQLILSGHADKVLHELQHKQIKQHILVLSREVAVIFLIFGIFMVLLEPIKIQAAILRFGHAFVSIFNTHTDYVYDESAAVEPEHRLEASFLEGILPEGFVIEEKGEDEYSSFYSATDSEGDWIQFNMIFDAQNVTLSIDTENAIEENLDFSPITIKCYRKPDIITYHWEYANKVYTLSGNNSTVLPKMLGRLIEKLIP